jgi:geranylgeranyl diphosphate synthase type I
MLHNATLVHDDIQDGDRLRRGKETVWVRHGVPQAINVGDLMLMLPFCLALEVDADARVKAALVDVLGRHATQTVRGQATELALPALRPKASVPGGEAALRAAFLRGIVGKTSALFMLPVEGAALIAGKSVADAHTIALPFSRLGVLFQMQDDVLDLYGDKGRDARGADLKEGKISSLVVEHLTLVPADSDWLFSVLSAPRDATRDDDVARAIDAFRSSGALARVLDEIDASARALETDAALATAPALREIALTFVSLVLKPIRHVLAEPRVR